MLPAIEPPGGIEHELFPVLASGPSRRPRDREAIRGLSSVVRFPSSFSPYEELPSALIVASLALAVKQEHPDSLPESHDRSRLEASVAARHRSEHTTVWKVPACLHCSGANLKIPHPQGTVLYIFSAQL